MGLLTNQRIQQHLGGGLMERLGINLLSQMQMIFLGSHKDRDVLRLIRRVRRERQSLLTAFESFMIYSLVRSVCDRSGEMAEVGVFRGGSAKLICEAKGDKPLYLFDTFEGLPRACAADGRVHRKHQYTCSLDSVREYLSSYPNVHFAKGLFPDTAGLIEEKRFCFAHFDVDLYESTKGCLEFFYPRMEPGGVMISHDYSLLAGVRQAFGEFFAERPEGIIELPTSQCMVVKL